MAVPGGGTSDTIYTSFDSVTSITGSSGDPYTQTIPAVETATIQGSFIFKDRAQGNDVEKVVQTKVLDLERRLIYITDDLGRVAAIEQII